MAVIPSEIGDCENLQEFYCSNNQVAVIPVDIGKLINLQEFDCSYNKVAVIPVDICKLINLRKFYCISNKITVIPLELVDKLINLQIFWSDIKITTISGRKNLLKIFNIIYKSIEICILSLIIYKFIINDYSNILIVNYINFCFCYLSFIIIDNNL